MAVHARAVEERVKQQQKSERAKVRKEQSERTRLLAPWRSGAVAPDERAPVCFLRFMLDSGLLVAGHGTPTSVTMVESHDDSTVELDESRPWLLVFNAEGPGKDMSMLRGAMGEKCIDDPVLKAEASERRWHLCHLRRALHPHGWRAGQRGGIGMGATCMEEQIANS